PRASRGRDAGLARRRDEVRDETRLVGGAGVRLGFGALGLIPAGKLPLMLGTEAQLGDLDARRGGCVARPAARVGRLERGQTAGPGLRDAATRDRRIEGAGDLVAYDIHRV